MRALLMVGGEGRRLRPLTDRMPKSLLQVANRPILEHTLLLLRQYGIQDVTLAVNYLASMIEDRFGNGESLGIRLSYQHERQPLGTAGGLEQLARFEDTVLMMNGDILTDLNVSEMLARHSSLNAAMTVASKVMYTDLSLGVLDVVDDGLITAYREKPRLAHRFGIGMYLLEPVVKNYISPGERVDVPELIARLLKDGQRVACYDHPGRWTDIGLPEDYARAQQESLLNFEVAARA